jgi:hypothetical protein
MKPKFIDVQLNGTYGHETNRRASDLNLHVPGCDCRMMGLGIFGSISKPCTITPCTATAFKNLQIQQLAHASSIASLKSSVNKLATSITPALEPAAASPKPGDMSIRKEVCHMLSALRESQAES